MHLIKKYRFIILTLLIASAAIAWIFINAPAPQEKPVSVKVPKVPYSLVVISDQPIPVFSRGRVSASEVRQITTEVPGLVKQVSEHLKKGATVKQHDLLIQLDEQPFILEVAQRQADLDRVKLELVRIEAQAKVAQKDLRSNATEYARHIPQVRHAKSQVAAAESALSYSQKKLEKTTISSPIDGKVVDLMVTEGEYINATSSIARIYGTHTIDVRLPLIDQQIDILNLARESDFYTKENVTSPRVILSNDQDEESDWEGIVSRVEGERDINLLVHVIGQVSIDAPSKAKKKSLLLEWYGEAMIEWQNVSYLQFIPRNAKQASNVIWLIDEKN